MPLLIKSGFYGAAAVLLSGAPGPLWALSQGARSQRGLSKGTKGPSRFRETILLPHSDTFPSSTVWGVRMCKRFCKMFFQSSTGRWGVLQLPCCPSKQGNCKKTFILQNLSHIV